MVVNKFDLGVLCTYAVRGTMGSYSFAPRSIRNIVRPLLPDLPDKSIQMMRLDCISQKRLERYGGDDTAWKEWKDTLDQEWERRTMKGARRI